MKNVINRTYRKLSNTDLPFLIFLVGIINVKLYVKVFFLLFYLCYIAYKKYKLPKNRNGVILFYFIMPVIGVIAPLLKYTSIDSVYWLGYFWGMASWIIAGIAFYLIYTTVVNSERRKILNTVDLFFALNILVSIIQLVIIMFMAHSIMPYWVWDSAEKFGTSTGDNLYGISWNNSITNSAISVIGIVYFLFNNKRNYAIACTLILLLSTSNFLVFISLFLLALIFIFSNKVLRKNVFFVTLCLLLYPLLSPTNIKYIGTVYNKFVSKDSLNKKEIHPAPVSMNEDYSYIFHSSEAFGKYHILLLKKLKFSSDHSKTKNPNLKLDPNLIKNYFYLLYGIQPKDAQLAGYSRSGKIYSLYLTAAFLGKDYKNLAFGAGTARFSSKQAIKMTGLGLQGNYPSNYVYASPEFFQYHLYSLLYFLSQDISLHSIINFPDTVYNQIAGEYGLLGIIAFIFLYIGYFWKYRKKYSYGLYLLILILLLFGLEYWFEMISITVIFELLMLLDIFAPHNTNATSTPSNSINASI